MSARCPIQNTILCNPGWLLCMCGEETLESSSEVRQGWEVGGLGGNNGTTEGKPIYMSQNSKQSKTSVSNFPEDPNYTDLRATLTIGHCARPDNNQLINHGIDSSFYSTIMAHNLKIKEITSVHSQIKGPLRLWTLSPYLQLKGRLNVSIVCPNP